MRKCLMIISYFIVIIANNYVTCNIENFNGRIAGDQTILECVNGYIPTMVNRNPKMYITTTQFAREQGYSAEDHLVKTDDGHILTIHRIPSQLGASPVLLLHGLLGSSFDWVVMGKEKALAFKLADAGYDVWMGNFRGNTYSRCHTKYEISSQQFWDFSWHEMGIQDLPAMISYVTNTTGQRVIYIGHSMGTTAFFTMSIKRPDIALKVKVMFALAPVVFMNHSTSPLRVLAPFTRQMEFFTRARGTAEILSQTPALKRALEFACTSSTVQRRICTRIIFSTTGFNSQQFNYTLTPDILYHVPAGSSLKVFIHYFQEYISGKFQNYDYGTEKNLKLYNSTKPPEYNISKIKVPVGLFWSDSDVFANPIDVIRLYEQLPNTILFYHIDDSNFNHLDYLYAIDAAKYVYDKLLSVIRKYK